MNIYKILYFVINYFIIFSVFFFFKAYIPAYKTGLPNMVVNWCHPSYDKNIKNLLFHPL